MKRYKEIVIHFLKVFALFSLSSLVFASSTSLEDIGSIITWRTVLIVLTLATLSGATALSVKVDKKLQTDSLKNPVLFVFSNMLGSWLAGFLGYFVVKALDTANIWNQLITIMIFAYFGAKAVEKLAEYRLGQLTKDDKEI